MSHGNPSVTRRWAIVDGIEFRPCADDVLAFNTGSGATHVLAGISGVLCEALLAARGALDLDELIAAFSGAGAVDVENALVLRESVEEALVELATIGLVREVGP